MSTTGPERPVPSATAGEGEGGLRPQGAHAGQSGQVTFEEAQKELEQIVHQLETGNAELDDAIKLWERGEELYRLCVEKLDSAQGKIEELASKVETLRPAERA
jgi:exodeoxyribonuclease VII small subunit